MSSLVSVIVPCYNYAHYITETIESLQAQTHKDWEAIVIDDGSKDNSREVVEELMKSEPRIRYIYQENKGLPGARNTGLREAKGDFVQFLDADDLLENQKLEWQVKAFEANPELDIAYSSIRYFFDGKPEELFYSMDGFNRPWSLTKSGKGKDLIRYMLVSCAILVNMPLLKRSTFDKVGLFTEDLKSCEDWEFWLRCFNSNCTFQYVDQPNTFSLVRAHENSMTKNRMIMLDSMIQVRTRTQPRLQHSKLKRLNTRFLQLDLAERGIEQQHFESRKSGFKAMLSAAKKQTSPILLLMAFVSRMLPHRSSIFLVKVLRSTYKKLHYLFFRF